VKGTLGAPKPVEMREADDDQNADPALSGPHCRPRSGPIGLLMHPGISRLSGLIKSGYLVEMGFDHPRRPKGTPKTGGRRKGTVNKRTLALRAELVAAGASPDQETPPFKFLSDVMNNEGNELSVRVDAARALIPYTNFRKGMVDQAGRDQPITVQVIRFGDMTSKPEPVTTIEHDSNS
jgi:hypothetical protein